MSVRFAPEPHRSPPRRQRPHRALQLAAGPASQRHLHPARRGHRSRALDGGIRSGDQGRPALARARMGRGRGRGRRRRPVPAVGAARALRSSTPSGCSMVGTPTTASARPRRSRPSARQRWPPGSRPSTRAAAASIALADARARRLAGERPAVRLRVPSGREVALRRPRPRPRRLPHRGHRRSGDRARRRRRGLQLRRRDRRRADADHPRRARRGSHLEHTAPDPGLRGLRLVAAGLCAPLAGARPRPRAAVEAPRRDLGGRVPRARATCPRRWPTTWP